MTRNGLPLWPVWEAYFQSCPVGSIVVRIHSQEGVNEALAAKLAAYNGKALPSEDVISANPRGSVDMLRIQLILYEAVGQALAENGCAPQFVQLLSERDAPVVGCATVHSAFAAEPRISRLQVHSRAHLTTLDFTDRGTDFTPLQMCMQWSVGSHMRCCWYQRSI